MVNRRIQWIQLGVFLFCFCLFCGCGSPYAAKRSSITQVFEQRHKNAINSNRPSAATEQYLRLKNMTALYLRNRTEFFGTFYDHVLQTRELQAVCAMAELSLLEGRKQSKRKTETAMAYYLTAAETSYRYLLANDLLSAQAALDPTYRFVAEIYNAAVSELVDLHDVRNQSWNSQGTFKAGRTVYEFQLADSSDQVWNPNAFDELIPAYEVNIKGLNNQYYEHGLGAPLIGLIKDPSQNVEWGEFFANQKAGYPVTAMLVFEKPRVEGAQRYVKSHIIFYNALTVDDITLHDMQIPLEVDYTKPLVIQLENIKPFSLGLSSMLNSDKKAGEAGLFLLEPYNPDKIPVLMVHGLMSSPVTWMDMFNDLRGQPEIRKRYQFWFFSYPTGLPVLYSASILRQQLLDIRQKLDPSHSNPNFNNMVLVGHSMGGLLSRVMMQDSQDAYYNYLFSKPIDQLPADAVSRELLQKTLFFERIPFVQRVIFISTPHRGSPLADRWYSGFASGMIELPGNVVKATERVFSEEDNAFKPQVLQQTKKVRINSIGNLSATSPFTVVYNQVAVRDDVTYHSIIGTRKDDVGPGSSDGVVPYESSHIDFAVSERLVHSNHGAHQHPDAIDEVKRILQLHLEESK